MLHHFEQPGISPEEILPKVCSALDKILLVLAVADLAQAFYQEAVTIVLNQIVPVGSPNTLDDVPPRATENRFQLLNDLAIAANGAVEPLQVAVHHKNQIVQL